MSKQRKRKQEREKKGIKVQEMRLNKENKVK